MSDSDKEIALLVRVANAIGQLLPVGHIEPHTRGILDAQDVVFDFLRKARAGDTDE